MRYLILSIIFLIAGCASVPTPDYISRVDHPYDRKIYASFEKVTGAMIYVLKKSGWKINTEAEPSIYERDDRYDNNGYQNLLIACDIVASTEIVVLRAGCIARILLAPVIISPPHIYGAAITNREDC